MKILRQASELQALLRQSSARSRCACSLGDCAGWVSLTEDRWPAHHVRCVGTLRDPDLVEPTFEELHPDGTRYESPDAPVAIHFFPYNRSDVWECLACHRLLLRYTEFGGYYIDHRVRELGQETPMTDKTPQSNAP